MKNKGFIVVGDWSDPNDENEDSIVETDLHIEDQEAGTVAPDDETTIIVSVWIQAEGKQLEFTRSEAKDFMTAMGIIVDRYEITPEEWEAKHA